MAIYQKLYWPTLQLVLHFSFTGPLRSVQFSSGDRAEAPLLFFRCFFFFRCWFCGLFCDAGTMNDTLRCGHTPSLPMLPVVAVVSSIAVQCVQDSVILPRSLYALGILVSNDTCAWNF